MTTDKRGKAEARRRKETAGVPYALARRETRDGSRRFCEGYCANCFEELPDRVDGLFCSELCRQTAETVRYFRRVTRDSRIDQPDVQAALNTRFAHLLAGGYDKSGRHLTASIRREVRERDSGRCVLCGATGEEIDHIDGSGSDLENLQLLCKDCHRAKTAARMQPVTAEQRGALQQLLHDRVKPNPPVLLCDDEVAWPKESRALKKARRDAIAGEAIGAGIGPGTSHASWAEWIDDRDAEDVFDPYEEDEPGVPSYFAQIMTRDD